MASLLRQIVAGPRARHSDSGLDLCYVTDNIIATSGPSSTYPSRAYRNPLDELVKFLDSKHDDRWCIWEFRAEGTGYPDSEVYNRIQHFPWPDHHPPPFKLIPKIMASMRNWLQAPEVKDRVAVMHCKAGKGRTGTTTCSYLVSEEGWALEDALTRFTSRRMRPGFGNGVSIPSQLRWLGYVDRWVKAGKKYVERPVEVLEVHVFGLRDGVKISVEGFEQEGKIIKTLHTFRKYERDDYAAETSDTEPKSTPQVVDPESKAHDEKAAKLTHVVAEVWRSYTSSTAKPPTGETELKRNETTTLSAISTTLDSTGKNVILRPSKSVICSTSDINLAAERRSRAGYGLTMVTSVAHVWFNTFFEGQGPERLAENNPPDEEGVFSIEWEPMDGIKGSSKKGVRAFDSVRVLWRFAGPAVEIAQPAADETVADEKAADWQGGTGLLAHSSAHLGLRKESADSADVSKANSREQSPVGGARRAEGKKEEGASKMREAVENVSKSGLRKVERCDEEDEGVNVGVVLPDKGAATARQAGQ